MTDKLNEIELNQLVTEAINLLQKNNFNIKISDIVSTKFFDIGRTLGKLEIDGSHRYKLILNNKLARKKKLNFILCVIYHELCHAIQFNEAFDFNIIKYIVADKKVISNTPNKTLAINTIFGENYHTKLWDDIANDINAVVSSAIPIKAFVSDKELNTFLEAIFMKETKIAAAFEMPAVVTDDIISGFTIETVEQYNLKNLEPKLQEHTATALKPKHNYRKWLEDK